MKRSAPTIIDVAELAGVSKSLVSLVMRGSPNVSDAKREAVHEAARELGYRPNAVARSLAEQRTYIIGVLVSDFGNPFFAEMLDGVEEAAGGAGYRALFNTGGRDVERELLALDTLLQLRIDGLLLASPRFDDAELDRIPSGLPVVMVGKDTDVPGVDVVINDDVHGSDLVVDHLVGLGHHRIAHLHGRNGAGAAERTTAYVAAMAARGLDPMLVEAGFTEEAGARGAAELLTLEALPTAVYAANDMAALGVTETLERSGLRIPEDVSLVGYDNINVAGLDHIGLTTVDQPRRTIGALAVDLLLERIEGGRKERRRVTVEPTFVERSTTGPPRGGV